jgi:hypothetical protein
MTKLETFNFLYNFIMIMKQKLATTFRVYNWELKSEKPSICVFQMHWYLLDILLFLILNMHLLLLSWIQRISLENYFSTPSLPPALSLVLDGTSCGLWAVRGKKIPRGWVSKSHDSICFTGSVWKLQEKILFPFSSWTWTLDYLGLSWN